MLSYSLVHIQETLRMCLFPKEMVLSLNSDSTVYTICTGSRLACCCSSLYSLQHCKTCSQNWLDIPRLLTSLGSMLHLHIFSLRLLTNPLMLYYHCSIVFFPYARMLGHVGFERYFLFFVSPLGLSPPWLFGFCNILYAIFGFLFHSIRSLWFFLLLCAWCFWGHHG